MNRKPQYNTTRTRRIVSFPNGKWQAQEQAGKKGTREHDHWRGLYRPTEYHTALRQRGE